VIAKLDASLYFSKVYGQCPQSGKRISLVLGANSFPLPNAPTIPQSGKRISLVLGEAHIRANWESWMPKVAKESP